jgi:ABC-type antimicrobial peptide transport system permease subunit
MLTKVALRHVSHYTSVMQLTITLIDAIFIGLFGVGLGILIGFVIAEIQRHRSH